MEKRMTAKTVSWYDGPASELAPNTHYPLIDLCKFLFAYLVVIIHVPPFSSFDTRFASYANYILGQGLGRIAVPFYFAAAGFLLFRKIDEAHFDWSPIRTYAFRILRLYGLWAILLLVGRTGHLWFLTGLAVATVFLSFLICKKVPVKWIAVICAVLYLVDLLGNAYNGILTPLRENSLFVSYCLKAFRMFFPTTRTGIFMGVPFVFIGYLLTKIKIVLPKSFVIFGGITSFFISMCESVITKHFRFAKEHEAFLFLPVFTFFLLYAVTHIQVPSRPIYKRLRVAGMLIFYSHRLVYWLVERGFAFIKKFIGPDLTNSLIVFCATVILATLLAFFTEWLSRKEKFTWLRYLWS